MSSGLDDMTADVEKSADRLANSAIEGLSLDNFLSNGELKRGSSMASVRNNTNNYSTTNNNTSNPTIHMSVNWSGSGDIRQTMEEMGYILRQEEWSM